MTRRGPAARSAKRIAALERIHADIRALRLPGFVGEAVHGPALESRIYLVGQAPGPHEARIGRPFAWTAGKTLFRWFERALGASEEEVRARVYMAAVVRCFPGKASSGGDRVPSAEEILACRTFIEREVAVLEPDLVIPVGRLAIREVLGRDEPLAAVVGRTLRVHLHGRDMDAICLPHPRGASTWFKLEPGRALLEEALDALARHPAVRDAFAGARPARGTA
ncbi:MAG: uracil-DNA glycosylase family protein [Anaeromyxobacteraceae bacterium]